MKRNYAIQILPISDVRGTEANTNAFCCDNFSALISTSCLASEV